MMNSVWLVSYVVLWLLVLFLLTALVGVLRQIGLLHEQGGRPPTPRTKLTRGERVPELELQTLGGRRVRLSELIERPTSLLVVSPGCSGCGNLLRQIADGELGRDLVGRIVVLSMAGDVETQDLLQKAGVPSGVGVLIDPNGEIRQAWGISATPTTVHVDERLVVIEQNLGFFNVGVFGDDAVDQAAEARRLRRRAQQAL